METTIVYWGYIRRMDKKMETTIAYIFPITTPNSKPLQSTVLGASLPLSSDTCKTEQLSNRTVRQNRSVVASAELGKLRPRLPS